MTRKSIISLGRNSAAIICWSYPILQTFILDIDHVLRSNLGQVGSLVIGNKWLITLLLITISLHLIKYSRFRQFLLFVWFYPIVLLFYILPKNAYFNSGLALFIAPAIYEFLASLKTNLLNLCFVGGAAVAISVSSNKTVITTAIVVLFFAMTTHLIRKITQVHSTIPHAA